MPNRASLPGIKVAVFCGGRGSATILRELLRQPDVRLSLLINAYDDGLSTGVLRGFVPGMLGASDFRKNVSRLLEMSSPVQFAVADLLEYRFPAGALVGTFRALLDALGAIADRRAVPRRTLASLAEPLASCLERLDADTARVFQSQLLAFDAFASTQSTPFVYADCAVGNLLLTGAFLRHERSFNRAVAEIARALRCRAEVLNVTAGESRILTALKEDGEILQREARIVAPQSAVPIQSLYLLPRMLEAADLAELAPLGVATKADRLASLHRAVEVSPEADRALREADLIVYGPGTQHSSLLPSFMTRGVPEAIAASRAVHRVFIVNLRDDFDTQGASAGLLVDRALSTMGDPENARRCVTEVFAARVSGAKAFPEPTHRGARVIEDDFENPALPGIHSGARIVERLREVLASDEVADNEELDIYVDLHRRSLAMDSLLQEFLEIGWQRRFSRVRLTVNGLDVPRPHLPEHLDVLAARHTGLFSETAALLVWLRSGHARFFASLTGDGEYRLRDIELAVDLLRTRRFGAILGARNQSKRQFFGSISDAYAGRLPMYLASVAGGFGVSALCGARFGLILSDPLTGFRVYDRLALRPALQASLIAHEPRTTLEITQRLVANGAEIAEIPVFYHHYPGFTDDRWRLLRGLVNALSVLRGRA